MRLGRLAVENVTCTVPGYRFELGRGCTLIEGTDVTVIANGLMVQKALKAAEILKAQGISAEVIDMHTIKPLDEELILASAKKTGAVVVSEEHTVIGGLGSAIAEFLGGTYPVPVMRHGVNDEFGRSGKAEEVLALYGLTAEVMAEKAVKAVAMK